MKGLLEKTGQSTTKNLEYTFDNNGNRTRRYNKTTQTTTDYAYDQADRLVSVSAGFNFYYYGYNGDGLRMTKGSGNAEVHHTWDVEVQAGLPLLMQDSLASYVYGPGGMLLGQISIGGTTPYYYHSDQLGSIRALTNSSGSVVNLYTYDAYGNTTSSTGSVDNPFKYTGEYADNETGFIYLRARYYDPESQQFLTVDPLVAWTEEAYTYVTGSPTNFVDPLGLVPSDQHERRLGPLRPGNWRYNGCPGDWVWWPGDGMCYAPSQVDAEITRLTKYAPGRDAWLAPRTGGGPAVSAGEGGTAGLGGYSAQRSNLISGSSSGGTRGTTSSSGSTGSCPNYYSWRNPVTGKTANILIPTGVRGPQPVQTGNGIMFVGGQGGPGLNNRVTGVRIMNPTPQYPNGFVVYMNQSGQTVNPFTGRTIPFSDPVAHIPLP